MKNIPQKEETEGSDKESHTSPSPSPLLKYTENQVDVDNNRQ